MNTLREKLAEYSHNGAWAGWMNHLFEVSELNEDGTATIPKWAVDLWKRKMNTLYSELPGKEKETDRKEADKMIEIIENIESEIIQEIGNLHRYITKLEEENKALRFQIECIEKEK